MSAWWFCICVTNWDCDGEVAKGEVRFVKVNGVIVLTFGPFDRHAVHKHQVVVGHLAHQARSFQKALRITKERKS